MPEYSEVSPVVCCVLSPLALAIGAIIESAFRADLESDRPKHEVCDRHRVAWRRGRGGLSVGSRTLRRIEHGKRCSLLQSDIVAPLIG